ncbi:MAG: lipopolysaccharide biosynthesis protein [Rhodanobacteraceae bacterium]|nr:MAG: lipopolysaccharide biosynthesis protein [Rhodanobacteraceae bacterium]
MEKKPQNIRGALSLSFVQTAITGTLSFASVIIVSHLLTPAEIGVFSIAAGLVALIHMLRDFGISEFVIQETALTEGSVRTVFTLNLVIAWLLGSLIFVFSGAIGGFYGDAGVARVLKVMSIVFLLFPFGTTTQALMQRKFEFGKLTKIRILESIARSSLVVILAYAGFSYMSMAWASVASISFAVLGCMLWGWDYRVKGLSLSRWKDVLHFGSSRTVSDIASQLGAQSANLIVGKMLGMTAAGLYSRGNGVVNLYNERIVGAVGVVAFPAFAREHRETGQAPQLFVKSLAYLTGISWPFFAAGIVLAFPIIRTLFGNQWDAAVPLMRWLCGAAIVGTTMYQCNSFLVALGHVNTVTRVEVTYQSARIGITVAAAFVSLAAVAAVQILVYLIATTLYYRAMRRRAGVSVVECAQAVMPSALATLATCAVPIAVVAWPGFVQEHRVAALALAMIGGCAGWLVAIRASRHPLLGELRRIIDRLNRRFGAALR